MFKFDKTDIQRFVVSTLGAIAVSATCVGAAIAPAKAADRNAPMSVAAWQAKVERRIDNAPEGDLAYQPQQLTVSTVAVNFTADGDYAGIQLAQPSGNRLVDNRAMNIARTVRFPAMPEGYRGVPTQVRMTLYFGPDAEAVVERERRKTSQHIQLAAM